jgi:uncharacterized protein YdeI (YjbR/CyaY-like superfamily)
MTAEKHLGYPAIHFKSAAEWRNWLAKNHAKEESLFLIIYRKESGVPSVYYSEAVDEAICFGWIDSKINKRDAESYYQYFAKRNPKSNWSKVNKAKVERLLSENKMAPAGLAMIELAKKIGTWTALDKVEELELPAELEAALNKNKKAKDYFDAFPRSVKRGILEWIMNAKREETKLKRINETVELAAKNVRANQYQRKEK